VQHFKHFIRCGTAPVPPHPQFKRAYNIVQSCRIASNVFVRYHCNALEIIIHEWMRKQAPVSVQLSWYPQNGELIRTKMVNSTKTDHNNQSWVLIFRQLYLNMIIIIIVIIITIIIIMIIIIIIYIYIYIYCKLYIYIYIHIYNQKRSIRSSQRSI
jgi:hypothetical protein